MVCKLCRRINNLKFLFFIFCGYLLKLENQFEIQKFGCFFISGSDSHLLVIGFFFFFLDLIWFCCFRFTKLFEEALDTY